jgi:hypothetical protein
MTATPLHILRCKEGLRNISESDNAEPYISYTGIPLYVAYEGNEQLKLFALNTKVSEHAQYLKYLTVRHAWAQQCCEMLFAGDFLFCESGRESDAGDDDDGKS